MRLLTKAFSSAVLFKLDLRFKGIINMRGFWAILTMSPECLPSLQPIHRNPEPFWLKSRKLLRNHNQNPHIGMLLEEHEDPFDECLMGSYQERNVKSAGCISSSICEIFGSRGNKLWSFWTIFWCYDDTVQTRACVSWGMRGLTEGCLQVVKRRARNRTGRDVTRSISFFFLYSPILYRSYSEVRL